MTSGLASLEREAIRSRFPTELSLRAVDPLKAPGRAGVAECPSKLHIFLCI